MTSDRVGEVAPWEECFLSKHKDPNSNSQVPCTKPGIATWPVTPTLNKVKMGELLGLPAASLAPGPVRGTGTE